MKFLGKKLDNPLVLASGILGNNYEILEEVHKNGCGLVTMKSIGPEPRDGHNNPTIVEFDHGMINAVGLPTPGYLNMDSEWEKLEDRNFPIIASIYGANVKEFVAVAKYVALKKPDFIEINISCPNTDHHGMVFGTSCELSGEVVSAVKRCIGKIPLIAKLTPQATNIAEIAKICEKKGADAICAINTVGPGMMIDIETAKPILQFKKGGVSGPAIKPIAVRCVFDIYEKVKIPIIGLGGITDGEDAIEMMMAGATLVGIGSAVYNRGIDIFRKVNEEIEDWLVYNKKTLKQIVGAAH
jgi:dihydroorotate dehydrogenase (NAD+) catalytic subunit